MKKGLFIGALICFLGCTSMNATTVTESIYYGTKANDSTSNPCKGNTTRVCGKTISTASYLGTDLTMSTEKIFDENGSLQHVIKVIERASVEQVEADYIRINTLRGATVSQTDNNAIED